MGFFVGIAAWAQANPLSPPPPRLPPHWLAPPIPRPEPAGFITGDWSVEYPEPEPQGSVDWTNPDKPIVRYVFPRAAMRDKP